MRPCCRRGSPERGMPTHAIRSTVYSDQLVIERNAFVNIRGYGVLDA